MTASSPAWEAWVDGIEATSAEAAGLWATYVFRPADGQRLIASAADGDEFAGLALRVITHVSEKVETSPRRKPALCMTCPRAIRRGSWFAVDVIMPSRSDPSRSIGSAICQQCATDQTTLTPKIIAAVRTFVPDAREIRPDLHKPGHA